jgi:thiol-disulfide isomerase/thioredoxin
MNTKQLFSVLIRWMLAGFIFFVPLTGEVHATNIGDVAPSFELQGENGEIISLAKLKGKVVYLDFWASWCGPCRQSFPWMNEMQEKYGQQGLEVLAINLDGNLTDAKKFLQENPAKFKIAYDTKAQTPKLLGVKGMPTSYLIDRQGRVVSVHVGFNLAKKSDLETELKQVLERK